MEQSQKETHWYLLTGLILGLVIGLVISILVAPIVNTVSLPSELSVQSKNDYRAMIALAYASNQDLDRALSRLDLLEDQNPVDLLVAQAQNTLASGASETISRALAELAAKMGQYLPTEQ